MCIGKRFSIDYFNSFMAFLPISLTVSFFKHILCVALHFYSVEAPTSYELYGVEGFNRRKKG